MVVVVGTAVVVLRARVVDGEYCWSGTAVVTGGAGTVTVVPVWGTVVVVRSGVVALPFAVVSFCIVVGGVSAGTRVEVPGPEAAVSMVSEVESAATDESGPAPVANVRTAVMTSAAETTPT